MQTVKILTAAVVLTAVALAGQAAERDKPIRAGIIGLDTSHVVAFTALLNKATAPNELAAVKIVAAYPGGSPDMPASRDRVKGFTNAVRGMGVEIVDSIDDLLKKVDVVLLESLDGRLHMAQARPVIAAKKPLFIDKPMAASLADAVEIFRLASERNVPCFSASCLRFSSGFQAVRKGTAPFGKIRSCVAWSPLHLEPHHPDLFFYGIHGVETLFTIMGPGCKTVTRVAPDKVVGVWKGGRQGTFEARKDYGAYVQGDKQSGNAGKFEDYGPLVVEIVKFFKSGKPPVNAEETLEILAFMEAADESKRQDGKTVSLEEVLEKAHKQALRIGKDAGNLIVTCLENPKSNAAYNRRLAAKELADYLERITGTAIPVVDKVDAKRIEAGGVIFVGPSEYTDALNIPRERADFGPGGYLIQTRGRNLAILGDDTDDYKLDIALHGDAGTYYGVAAFLKKFGGVRWLWPGELGTVVPKRESLSIPHVEIHSRPAYLRRMHDVANSDLMVRKPDGTYSFPWGGTVRVHQWMLFQRRHGAGVSLPLDHAHYGDNYLKADQFQTHPEYFAFYDGKRQPWHKPYGIGCQVCNSNPEVARLMADAIVKNCPPDGGGFSISPNDGYGFCLCENCQKMDINSKPWPKTVGSGQIPNAFYNEKCGAASDISNRIWTFNNEVARLVAQRAPLANLGAHAYSCYVRPPEDVLHIEDNIYVMICDYWLTSADSSAFKEGWETFTKWGKKAKHLGLYGYYFGETCRPHHFVGFLRKFHNLGGVIHYGETMQSWANRWSEYTAGLDAMWDPYIDADAVLDDYLEAGFGLGRTALRQYLDLYEQASLLAAPYVRNPKFPQRACPPSLRAKLRSLLDQALLATKGTEAEARVRFVGEGWELLDSLYGLAEAAGHLKGMGLAMPGFDQNEIPPRNATPEEVKARIRDAKKCWDRLRAVMTMVEKKEGFSIPWFSRNVYAGAFWGSLAYSWGTAVDGFYASLVEGTALPLPLQWRFQIDPKQEGEKAGWFRSDMDDSQWGTIRTDACWEEQGFGQVRFPENGSDGYNGKAWYRVHTTIPESRKGQRIWLELGAVDESFTAWVNGKQCATFDYDKQPDKDAWQEPHLIDITNAVRYGQDNLIAVEVVDLKGSGGIWKPCFIKFDQKKTK